MALLIQGGWVVGHERGSHVLIPNGVVVVDGNRVVHVGKTYDGTVAQRIEAPGMLVSPGFIDTHVHAGSRALHRLFSDSGRPELFGQPFLEVAIARPGAAHAGGKRVDALTGMDGGQRRQLEAEFTIAELIANGITTFLEYGAKLPMQESLRDEALRLGMRAYLAAGFESGNWSCDAEGRPIFDWDEAAGVKEFEAGLAFIAALAGKGDDRLRGALVPRFAETCSPALLRACRDKARELGLPVAIHAAYNVHEFYQIVTRERQTPIEFLEAQGLLELGPTLNLGHCNFVGELAPLNYSGASDVARIGRHGCTVSHCPVNLVRRARYLDSWKRYREAGVNLALGTDTYPRDMMMQMRTASYFGKVIAHDLSSATAGQVYEAVTTAPAKSLGRDDLGRLAPGAKADIILVDLSGRDSLRFGPVRDPIRALVECGVGDDVDTVIIDGAVRMRNRAIEGVDLPGLRQRAQVMADGVWGALADWDPLHRDADAMNPPSFPIVR
jgi:5-methylthioadenosine/S-adenosylhomocysteine deaminase